MGKSFQDIRESLGAYIRCDEHLHAHDILWKSRIEQAVTLSAKDLTSSLYDGTRPEKKVFREPPESVFTLGTPRVYPDYLFFPGGYTGETGGVAATPPTHCYFAVPIDTAGACHRQIVTYSASRCSCSELRVGRRFRERTFGEL